MPYSRVTSKSQPKREWVRTFEVGRPRKNENHMIYDVTSVLFPAGFPEAGTRLTTIKRFSQFQKLYNSLLQIHQKLHIKGDPPPKLPKTSYFNRFEREVLEERREACLKLLQHAGANPILYSSQVFVAFLSDPTGSGETALSPSIYSEEEEVDQKKECSTGSQTKDEAFNQITSLTEKGDIMDATILSTKLLNKNSDLPPPLAPVHTPTHNNTPDGNTKDNDIVPFKDKAVLSKVSSISKQDTVDTDLPKYLAEAADSIGNAIRYESEENWEQAVSSYRSAIGTLLTSVQYDPCLKRQASVKRRISSYIEKAEALMKMDELKEMYQQSPSKTKLKRSSKIPHLDLFGKNMLELRRYKIKKILSSQVLLADQHNYPTSSQNRRLESPSSSSLNSGHNEVVIKTLQKSSHVYKSNELGFNKKSILPINVSYMTKLIRYYENDDFLHLVLEYVSGGELYDLIDYYFQKHFTLQPSNSESCDVLDTIKEPKYSEQCDSMKVEDQTNLSVNENLNSILSQSSHKNCPSPYGGKSISVIKPSSSFINIRKKSLVRQVFDNFKSNDSPTTEEDKENLQSRSTFYVDRSSEEKDESASLTGSITSIDYICTYPSESQGEDLPFEKKNKLICINKEGIETIDCDNSDKNQHDDSFDFVDDFADETGEDIAKSIILKKTRLSSSVEENLDFSSFDLDEEEDSISATLNQIEGEYRPSEIRLKLSGKTYSEPVKLVQDSKSLLASVSSKLAERQSQSKNAENILSNLQDVESKIQTHLNTPSTPSKDGSTMNTPFEHTPAKVHPSLLFTPQDISKLAEKKACDQINSISPLSPSTLATTPTSMMSSPPKCSSSSSSELGSPGSTYSKDNKSNKLNLWDLVPYYDHVNLKLTNCIPIGLIRKWSAQICKALFSLHSRGIIIQDFRPQNLLLDLNGNIKLTYQCDWVSIDKKISIERLLDENDGAYCAPELGRGNSITPAVDWWSVGVIMYELYVGERFTNLYPSGLLQHTPVQFDEGDLLAARKLNALEFGATTEEIRFEQALRDLITKFLIPLPEDRMQHPEDIISHRFFKGVNWENLKQLI